MRLFRSARWLLLALLVCLVPASSFAGVFISVGFGPPVLPVYVVPPCPQPHLIWTPGYWSYGDQGYFWVPGAWVPAPFPGGLWTPGYWGWRSGLYVYNPGYWGLHVGYYGGINYGGGYLGIGFAGGEWRGGTFAYNTAVVNVNTTIIHNTFVDRTVVDRYTVANPSHAAFSGGPGGVQHVATPQEQIAAHETHTAPTTFQAQHIQAAQSSPTAYAKNNGGHPTTLAVAKPLPLEAHTAPPVSHITPSTSNGANKTAADGGSIHPGGPAGPGGGGSAETRTVTPPRNNTPPKTYAPPKGNPPPPKGNPPTPKPEGKPKPEGREK
jgi:hypothetical protein